MAATIISLDIPWERVGVCAGKAVGSEGFGRRIEKCLLPSFSFLFRLFKLLSLFSMLEFLISSLTLGFLCGFRPVLRCHIKNGMCSQILRAVPHSWGLRQGEVMVSNSQVYFHSSGMFFLLFWVRGWLIHPLTFHCWDYYKEVHPWL